MSKFWPRLSDNMENGTNSNWDVKQAAIEQLYRIRTLGLDTDKSAEQILDEILYGD